MLEVLVRWCVLFVGLIVMVIGLKWLGLGDGWVSGLGGGVVDIYVGEVVVDVVCGLV